MQSYRSFVEYFVIIIISVFGLTLPQDITTIPEKPTFPDVFQVEVEGIFQEKKEEVDGSIYYDKPNNRVVLSYTYQNDTTTSIYNFNSSQLIYISGVECSVSEISDEAGSFFQYKVDKVTKKKTLASPEEIFFFTKSVYETPQPASRYPSYVYKANIDIPEYELTNCTVIHIFSKPEEEKPNCDNHLCKPTLVTLSVTCPSSTQEDPDVSHVYNFFRFRSAIKDTSVFQPPVGVHCDVVGLRPFPELPLYFSFSYELIEQQKGSGTVAEVYTVFKKIWYDTKLKLIRMDEFDENGLLLSSRILDFYGQIAYTIVTSLPVCEPGALQEDVALDEMTRLPKVLFARKPEDKKDAVYIGKRSVHGLDYDVWTQSVIDDETEAKIVYEYYFTNNIQSGSTSKNSYLQLSHADIYTYEKNDNTGVFELKLQTYLSLSNFRSSPKEWEAFDVSSCFKKEEKKGFILKVEGPPTIKDSLMFEEVLEKLYMKLIIVTNASVIRINQLEGRFNGIYLSEFTGWILKKIERKGLVVTKKEPDMEETYTLIEKAAAEGKLTIKIKKDGKDQVYKITSVSVKTNDTTIIPEKPTFPDVFQVEMEGIFQDEMAEIDGSIYYDRPNNRVVLSYTYQNETTTGIYNFNDNQLISISGVECSVSEISDESGSFFQYKVDKVTKKKTLASPEEIFFFAESEYAIPQPASRYPSYVYTANLDIPQYELTNCTVIHIFSKPEEQKPNCDSHLCKPTLVTLSVTCPSPTQENPDVSHVYNFFRFRSAIKDTSVFQPPVGVHCDVVGLQPFPELPLYFSFSYELIEEQKGSVTAPGVYTVFKKVWYDTELKLIRMDEFDEDGLLLSSRVFDFYGQIAYTIVATLPVCEPGDLPKDVALDEMTRLPKVLFARKPEDKKDAVYIGKRSVHGLDYDVWTQSTVDDETEAKIVYEYYFTNIIQSGSTSKDSHLQLSHSDIYTYEKNDDTGEYELKLQTYLALSNFRSKPKEWEAFDVSSCFKKEEKKGFSLKVEGPPTIKDSLMFEEVLEKLYMKLIFVTNASLTRISQIEGRFNGIYISEFTGWILKKIERKGWEVPNKEPDMEETFSLIEKAAAEGKLTIKVKKDGKDQVYKITSVSVKSNAAGTCISGGTMAIVSVILLFMGISFGFVGYYVFLKKKKPLSIDRVELHNVK